MRQTGTVFIGSDHNGYHLKEKLEAYLLDEGITVADMGDELLDPNDDFTVFATRVISAMQAEGADARGILICGSGQGMLMAANRHKGIRAGLGWSVEAAVGIRHDEDSNVLALPAEVLAQDAQWQAVVDAWLQTPFAGAARYKRRNRQLDEI